MRITSAGGQGEMHGKSETSKETHLTLVLESLQATSGHDLRHMDRVSLRMKIFSLSPMLEASNIISNNMQESSETTLDSCKGNKATSGCTAQAGFARLRLLLSLHCLSTLSAP